MWSLGPAVEQAAAGRRRRRSWATALCRRIWARAPAKRILSAAPARKFCSAVRARTFSPISPSAMAATGCPDFDPAKDVIDLSHIDADITQRRPPEFHLHRHRPIQRRRSGALSTESDEQHHHRPGRPGRRPLGRLYLTLAGLVPLTAANFALTPSQSSADLADGAALTYSKVTTAAGAPPEYAYSNVQGRAYTSYRIVLRLRLRNLAADDLNLSSSANELVLYDPSLTVTRGGGSETLTGGDG